MLEDLQKPQRRYPCRIGELLETLDPKDAAILAAAIDDLDWSPLALAQAVSKRGISLSRDPIIRHRNRECRCVK